MTDRRKLSISATRISVLSCTALSGLHWKPDYPVLPEKERFCGIELHLVLPSTILRAPPRGIPGYSLFSKVVYYSGGKHCTFDLHPSGTTTHY